MAFSRGRCTNFDYCALATKRQDIEVELGDNFACPECHRALSPPPAVGTTGNKAASLILMGLGVAAVGGGVFAAVHFTGATPPHAAQSAIASPPQIARKPVHLAAAAAPVPVAAVAAAIPEHVLLRLSGSNTIGAALGPKLAQAYMTSLGETGVSIEPAGKPDEVRIVGTRGQGRDVITVAAHGSATAFTDLASDAADVGMASRRIKPAEITSLAKLGDLTSISGEHVLALDGIAVIVNPANPLPSIRKDQLRDIFNGTITDWSKLGGAPGAIHVYARDDKSGTFDTFKSLVLNGTKLAPGARRLEDSRELSADVSADSGGIGFIGLPYILSARSVPVADTGATPLVANRLTVGTEDYPLSRRLFLYTAVQSGNPLAQQFAEYALSPAGQAIVEENGFVPLTVKAEPAPLPQTASDKYRAVIGHATRLSTNFRFQPNSAELDNRGQRDLDRLVNYVVSAHAAPSQIILVGFADNKGSASANLTVSKKRADAVAAVLAEHGVKVGKVLAFGADLPVADNASDDGREKNRRVEVYVQL
jgi:phosphate transport system substrate-binding protein